MVKRVYGHFDKRREWGDKGSSGAGPVAARNFEGPSPTQKEETRDWLETGSILTNVVKGSFGRVALEELTQMVRDLQIAHAWMDDDEQSQDRRPPAGHRCMWSDAVSHIQKDCVDFTEALKANVVYLWNG